MSRALLIAAAVASIAALALLAVCCPGPREVGRDWTPERLRAELAALGDLWELCPDEGQGLARVLKRPGDATPWAELLQAKQGHARLFRQRPGRLLIWVGLPGHGEPDSPDLELRHLFVRGHPDDLRRIASLFGR